jgi:hypothetical protein
MSDRLRVARTLTLTDWLAISEAWWTMLWFYVLIRTTSFERLNRPIVLKHNSTPNNKTDLALHLQRLVHYTARMHLLAMTCLPRAFTLRHMLERRGISARVQIGVTRSPHGFHAHAWLEVDGQQVGEPEDITERFQKLNLPV